MIRMTMRRGHMTGLMPSPRRMTSQWWSSRHGLRPRSTSRWSQGAKEPWWGGTRGSGPPRSLGSVRPKEVSRRVEPPRSVGSLHPEEVSGRAEPLSLEVQCSPLGVGQLRQRLGRGPALIRQGQVPSHRWQNAVIPRRRGKQSPSPGMFF
jgi:hypothetical protein